MDQQFFRASRVQYLLHAWCAGVGLQNISSAPDQIQEAPVFVLTLSACRVLIALEKETARPGWYRSVQQ